MVEHENLQFHEEYMNDEDPSILHFLLASGDDVCHTDFGHVDCLQDRVMIFLSFHPYLLRSQASNSEMT